MSLPMNAIVPGEPSSVPLRHQATTARTAPELSIVVPVFRGAATVRPFVERLREAFEGVDWEVIFVDDNSPDATASVVHTIGDDDPRVRCIRRVGRNGLAQTCLVAMLASRARHVAMLEVDPGVAPALPRAMLERARRG